MANEQAIPGMDGSSRRALITGLGLLAVGLPLGLCYEALRRGVSRGLRAGSLLMPLGFFLGGVLNGEANPSLGILLVPAGGLCLLWALARAALGARAPRQG